MIKVTVIGSGNVGFHLVNLFYNSKKIHLNEWYSRSIKFDPRVKVINQIQKLSESDIRLIYNAVDFYYKNREPPEKRPSYANEPNRHLEYVRQSMMTIMMESSFQKNK